MQASFEDGPQLFIFGERRTHHRGVCDDKNWATFGFYYITFEKYKEGFKNI